MSVSRTFRKMAMAALALGGAALLAGCEETGTTEANYRAFAPISPQTLELMSQKGTDKDAPMLIRAYKKEAELEVWKRKPDGKYVFLKKFPMCRWSGQLGPKVTEGDRQVPEGFYTITPGQMNPNSHYYLSFNVGYPNAYDRANGHSGGSIMVHGICSSAGCFSMTDKQIEEIYAIARESFAGGQRAIQMQSFPFKMTADNMAKLRLDPNMAFWRELKKGADYFEVTKAETPVGVCNKHYVFGATPKNGARFDALSACPPLNEDPSVKQEIAAKQSKDEAETAELVAKGVKPVRILYADGGQNPEFAHQVSEVSRPDALAAGATEIALDAGPKSKSVAVQIAAAKAQSKALLAKGNVITGVSVAEGSARSAEPTVTGSIPKTTVVAGQPATTVQTASGQPASANTQMAQVEVPATFNAAPSAFATTETKDQGGVFSKFLSFGSATKAESAPAVQVEASAPVVPAQPVSASPKHLDRNAKPHRPALLTSNKPAGAAPIEAPAPTRTTTQQMSSALPKEITGDKHDMPKGFMAMLPGFN